MAEKSNRVNSPGEPLEDEQRQRSLERILAGRACSFAGSGKRTMESVYHGMDSGIRGIAHGR